MQCELQPTASAIKSGKSWELAGSPNSTGRVRPRPLPVSSEANQFLDDSPNFPGLRTVELHNGDSDGQDDTAQPRSTIPPVMIYPPPPPPPISATEMNAPPPPPMPTPNGARPSLIPGAPRSVALDKLDDEQQSLRDLRDKLVGARFSVAAKRRELRDLHIETGAKDGHVFNLLRQYLNKIRVDLPQDIEESLNDASSLRDRLGLSEVEYDEAEVSYNTLEWKYSRRETRFVEELLKNRLVPSDAIDRSRSADNLEILHLSSSMNLSTDDKSMAWNHTAFTDEPDPRCFTQQPIDLRSRDVVSSHKTMVGHQQLSFSPSYLGESTLMQSKDESYAHLAQLHLNWLRRRKRIDAWLLETVDNSPVQKVYLRAVHDFGFSDKSTWWEHTKWLLIQDYWPVFNTGDSMASKQASSPEDSMSNTDALSSNSAVLEPHGVDTVLLGFRPSNTPDPPTVSSDIKPSDLHDTVDEAPSPRIYPVNPHREAANSAHTPHASNPPVPSRIAAAERVAIPNDDMIDDEHTCSPPFIDASSLIEPATYSPGMERASPNTAPAILYQSGQANIRSGLDHLQEHQNSPEIEISEPMEATVSRINSYSTPSSPHRSLPSAPNTSSPRKCREPYSQTPIPLHRRLIFRRSSSSAPPSPVSSPSKGPASSARPLTDQCLVM